MSQAEMDELAQSNTPTNTTTSTTGGASDTQATGTSKHSKWSMVTSKDTNAMRMACFLCRSPIELREKQ